MKSGRDRCLHVPCFVKQLQKICVSLHVHGLFLKQNEKAFVHHRRPRGKQSGQLETLVGIV